jgi:hypothetical protein
MYTEVPTLYTSHCLFWENEDDCMENCPGWGSIWTQLELLPGTGILYDNPLFINEDIWNFSLQDSSPCIDTGYPNLTDPNGTISDIGAIPLIIDNCSINGDLNSDYTVNVTDVVILINCILNNSGCSICFDINIDDDYNVLDIVEIVNIIID